MKRSTKFILFAIILFLFSFNKNHSRNNPSDDTPTANSAKRSAELGMFTSVEYGKINLAMQQFRENSDAIVFTRDGNTLKTLNFKEDVYHGFYDPENISLKSKIFLADINQDKLDDVILYNTEVIGAGPQAGQEWEDYICFLQSGNSLIKSDYYPEVPCSNPDIYFKNILFYKKYGHNPVGLPVPGSEKPRYLMKENENLIFTMEIEKNNKTLTVAVDHYIRYLVYRFGTPEKIELEILQNRDDPGNRVTYYEEKNDGFTRFHYKQLTFKTGSYEYVVFNNYDENGKLDGDGVLIKNLSTKTQFRLNGINTNGNLDLLSSLKWLEKKYKFGDDYLDEQ